MEKKNSSTEYLEADYLRAIFSKSRKPLVLRKFLNNKWKCLSFTKSDWVDILGNQSSFPFQFGKLYPKSVSTQSPQWEAQSIKMEMTLGTFFDWEEGKTCSLANELQGISLKDYWAYMRYYYTKDLDNLSEVLYWGALGFPEIKATDSTLWMGTTGANTPCHIDTYGSNIVCQIFGRKRWILFDHSESKCLYPTRVPYEESSIYSEVNFPYPEVSKFPEILDSHPYVITLEPGDVMFVPKHWWHFVENLELSISINTWIHLTSDDEDRIKESLVLYQVGSLCQSLSDISLLKTLFNPNMVDYMSMDSSELLEIFKHQVLKYKDSAERKANNQNNEETTLDEAFNEILSRGIIVENVSRCNFNEYCSLMKIVTTFDNKKKKINSSNDFQIMKLLINSLTDNRVTDIFKLVLDENITKLSHRS